MRSDFESAAHDSLDKGRMPLMRTGILVTLICIALSGLAIGDDAKAVLRQQTSIPPEELRSALTTLANEFHFQILYQTGTVESRCTRGVSGSVTQDEALEQVLRGTGLTYRYLDTKTLTIVPQPGSPQAPASGVSPSAPVGTCTSPGKEVQKSHFWNPFRRAEPAAASGQKAGPATQGPTPSGAIASNSTSSPLLAVIVAANRMPTAVDHIPGAVSVIGAPELAHVERSSLDPDQVLVQAIPGYTASTDDLTTSGELLRGKRPEFFLDGVPMSTPLEDIGRMASAMVDPAVVERIEVVDGASAIEGLGGAGGIINYITKTPGKEGLVDTVRAATETQFRSDYFGWKTSNLMMLKRRSLDLLLFLGTQTRPMYYDARGDLEYINSNGSYMDSEANAITAKLGYDFGATDAQRLQLYFNRYDLEGDNDFNSLNPGNRALGIVQSAERGPNPGPAAENHTREASVTYTNASFAGGVLTALAYQSREAFGFPGAIDPTKQDPRIAPIGTLIDASAITSTKDGAKLYWMKSDFLTSGLEINFGYDFNEDTTAQKLVLTDRIWLPPLHFRANSGYVQMSLDRGPLTLSAGTRYQAGEVAVPTFHTLYETAPASGGVTFLGGSKNYSTTVHNLGAVYRFLPGWSAFVGFSQGYQLPDIGQVIRNTDEPGQSMNTLVALEPIVTNSYETGVNWRASEAVFGLDAYYAHSPANTLVVNDPNTELQTVSRNPVQRQGIEFSGHWRVDRALAISGSYSHMLAYTSVSPGAPVDVHIAPAQTIGQEPDKAVLRVDWSPIRALAIDLVGTHFAGMSLNRTLGPPFQWTSTAYTVVDGSVTYDMSSYGSISLGCSNMTNTFHIMDETSSNNTSYYSIHGRKFIASYKVTLQ